MLGDYVCRVLVQVFGYIWPAYQCYKAIEQKNSEAVQEWCMYWFIMALFVMAERVLDLFIFWIPLYYEAKLLFVVWLWYPSTKGAVSLYTHTLQPLLAAHEATIDQKLADIREVLFDSFSANFYKVSAWMQEMAHMVINKMRNVQNKPESEEQTTLHRRSSSSMSGGISTFGRSSGSGNKTTDGRERSSSQAKPGQGGWTSPVKSAAQAVFDAVAGPKRD